METMTIAEAIENAVEPLFAWCYVPDYRETRGRHMSLMEALDAEAEKVRLHLFPDTDTVHQKKLDAAAGFHDLRLWPPLFSLKHGNKPPPILLAQMWEAKCYSVEDLAALKDPYLVHHGGEWKAKAAACLEHEKGRAVLYELAEENARMAAELEAKNRRIAKLEATRKKKRKILTARSMSTRKIVAEQPPTANTAA